jgi:Raf kinase inhibitor-like YbhB/YbcL family protein
VEILKVKSKAFNEGDWIPVKNSARGEDLSPDFEIEGMTKNAKSIAITLDDASHPIFPNYNHWVIWNIPVQTVISEGIAYGNTVDSLCGAMQGIAYGRHRYKGPKPPLKSIHTYVFTVYILDSKLELAAKSKKRDLLNKIEGHILQQATLSGKFQSHRS